MKVLWIGMTLSLCGVATAQDVFTNGIDVNGQAVQGVGVIDFSATNNISRAPAAGQLMGVDPVTGNPITDDNYLIVLRALALTTDQIAARTSAGLTFYDAANNAILSIQNGTLLGNGSGITNLSAGAITSGQLPASVLPSGGVWDAGGLVVSNAQFSGLALSVAGNTGNLQFNNAGVLGGSDNLSWNGNSLLLGGAANDSSGALLQVASQIKAAGFYILGGGAGLDYYSDERSLMRSVNANSSNIGVAIGAGWSGGGGLGGNPAAVVMAEDSNGYWDSTLSLFIAPESQWGNLLLSGGGYAGGIIINSSGLAFIGASQDDGSGAALQVNGDLSLSTAGQIKNLLDPTDAQDAATKNYVDNWASTTATLVTSNLTVTGAAVLSSIPAQGDLNMGSFTNQPGM